MSVSERDGQGTVGVEAAQLCVHTVNSPDRFANTHMRAHPEWSLLLGSALY